MTFTLGFGRADVNRAFHYVNSSLHYGHPIRAIPDVRQMSKSAMAQAMRTSRSQLDRILDPDNDHIRLDTLAAAANVLGLNLRIELVG